MIYVASNRMVIVQALLDGCYVQDFPFILIDGRTYCELILYALYAVYLMVFFMNLL